MPAEHHGKSRVWAVDSRAQRPAHGGDSPVGVSQQIGYRTPCLTGLGAALNSGLLVAAVDRESVVTVSVSSSAGEEEGAHV